MKKNIAIKFISVLLSVITITSVMTANILSASALVTEIIESLAESLIETGCRTVYKVANSLTEDINIENQQAIRSTTSYLISYESGDIYEVKELCQDILDKLEEIDNNITNSTNYISAQINRGFSADAKENFLGKNGVWANDVTKPIKNNNLDDVYKKYIYYFVTNALYNNDDLLNNETVYNKVKAKWPSLIKEKITENTVKNAKEVLDKAFLNIIDSGASKEDVYTTSIVNHKFINTLTELADNYVQGKDLYDKGNTSVASSAATCAYYYFPYSYQQYKFIKSEMQNQVMVTTILAMAYNEFLSTQGEYLSQNNTGNWCDNIELQHTSLGDNNYYINQTYNELKQEYIDEWQYIEKEIVNLYNSPLYINASSFNGNLEDIQTSLNKYMTEEDAVSVDLKIQNYCNEVNYDANVREIANSYDLKVSNTKTTSKYIPSTLKFNRVQTGVNGDIYYILDPNQFTDKTTLDIDNMTTRIKRKNMLGIDATIGDLYELSCDYLNLIKPMSDGANTYVCPSDLNTSLSSLFKTPSYSSIYSNTPSNYLEEYLPTKASDDTYLLSANYANNFGTKLTYMKVHSGKVTMSNLYNQAQNSKYVSTDTLNCEDLYNNNSHKYSLILTNKNPSENYHQNARVACNEYSAVSNASIVYDNHSYTSQQAIESGKEITIKFQFNPDTDNFVSLKCLRNNSETTETLLIDGEDELKHFYNSDTGYYEFNTYMPYSDTTFYFESYQKGIDVVIQDYDDLCQIANNINNGSKEYLCGNYTLANDIDCKGKNWVSIGTDKYSFMGTFDGQGHTISNLNIDSELSNGAKNGLFKCIGKNAVVKNVMISNASVFTNEGTVIGSGVIAKQNNGTISNCMVSDSSIQLGNYMYLGGVAGLNNGIIENCGVVNSHITRRYGGTSSQTMGGITQVNKGYVGNCYTYNCSFNNGTKRNAPIVASGNKPLNCYYFTNSTINKTYGTEKTEKQFKSGEVAYCLNSGITDGTQSWYQNIDNKTTENAYPVLLKTSNNTVYKTNSDMYSNYKAPTLTKQ